MKQPKILFLAVAVAAAAVLPAAQPARADTTSTAMLAGAAAGIIGAILMDSNNQPYYVDNGRHVYVSRSTATYYRSHGNARGTRPENRGPMPERNMHGGPNGR